MQQPHSPRRIFLELTPNQQARLEQARDETEQELPELLAQERELDRAAGEASLSGQLRRAVQNSGVPLPLLAQRAGVPLDHLGEFLRGERPLPSNIIDRLTAQLGLELTPTRR